MGLSNKKFLSNSVTLKVTLLLLLLTVICQSTAKRFDCRMFCKETGFHGMVGGCRCSFTLFTAKRAIRDPQEIFDIYNKYKMNQYFSKPELEETDRINPKFRINPNLLTRKTLSDEKYPASNGQTVDKSRLLSKRSEIEQDLDNGDTRDYLRLAY